MMRTYRNRQSFGRDYWILMGLYSLGQILALLGVRLHLLGSVSAFGIVLQLTSGIAAAAMLMILLRFRLPAFAAALVLLTGADVLLMWINGVLAAPADIALPLAYRMAAYGLGILLVCLFKGRDWIAAVVLAALYPLFRLCSLWSVPNYLIRTRPGLLNILLTILLPTVLTSALSVAGWFVLDRLLRPGTARFSSPHGGGPIGGPEGRGSP